MNNTNIKDKISVPYAEALLELAKKSNLITEMVKDLSFISEILSQSSDLQLILANPLVGVSAKKNILDQLFADKINRSALNFLLVLVDRRRIYLLLTIIHKYLELNYLLESITIAELFTAVSFSEEQQSALVEKLKVMTNSKNIKLVITINSDLIGGFIVKIGSKVIDASISGKLHKMSFYLNTN